MKAFLTAAGLLTVIPVRTAPVELGRAAAWFPVIGALVGAAAGLVFIGARAAWPSEIAALVALVFLAWIGGGLHEDGLADVADSIGMPRSRERALAILKDSRIGAFGATALILITLVRWQALSRLHVAPLLALIAAQAVSRGAITALAWITRPAAPGSGHHLCSTLTSAAAIAAILLAAVAALPLGLRTAWLICGGALLIVAALRRCFLDRLGGVTGDCFGACSLLVDTYVLLICACARCT